MTVRYHPLGKERFTVERTFEGEQIRIKAKRQIVPMLFLPVWLAGWTAGDIAAITQLMQHFEPFLVFWLCGSVFSIPCRAVPTSRTNQA
ncbi:hypothetical protein [Novosphingobium sp. SG707]|uniref:hypothetical protein n=1 Tax=Novosphingobium sp. SG707 TaxID=2586996 RepID=UPI001445C0F0|nr:hypothetical protein [Novosphingobium sp. SG707]NKJ01566.1 hypothetical protein [Novosphingobium sp. SG707]